MQHESNKKCLDDSIVVDTSPASSVCGRDQLPVCPLSDEVSWSGYGQWWLRLGSLDSA